MYLSRNPIFPLKGNIYFGHGFIHLFYKLGYYYIYPWSGVTSLKIPVGEEGPGIVEEGRKQ